LIEARCTQRVASPDTDLPLSVLEDLWRRAAGRLSLEGRAGIEWAPFTWHDQTPREIGEAMHAGVAGGEGMRGLLQRACLDNLRQALRECSDPGEEVRRWLASPPGSPEETDQDVVLPARVLPGHLAAKLQEGGQFRCQGEHLVDHRGRPLSAVRLMKLVRLLARGFGRYFLSFQNTHPLLGVVLVRQDLPGHARQRLYREAGELVAAMGLLARSRGLTSIIKSGPVEIAREAITAVLARSAAPSLREPLARGTLAPLLLFQVGAPLGPDDRVCAGQPDEHDGFAERLLDRRAPRAPLSQHYLPAD
jgi:hypothetical protein